MNGSLDDGKITPGGINNALNYYKLFILFSSQIFPHSLLTQCANDSVK